MCFVDLGTNKKRLNTLLSLLDFAHSIKHRITILLVVSWTPVWVTRQFSRQARVCLFYAGEVSVGRLSQEALNYEVANDIRSYRC